MMCRGRLLRLDRLSRRHCRLLGRFRAKCVLMCVRSRFPSFSVSFYIQDGVYVYVYVGLGLGSRIVLRSWRGNAGFGELGRGSS
jgi:hypothetical protein